MDRVAGGGTWGSSTLLAVNSRVSWGAIAAGAMITLTVYVLLALLGVEVGIEDVVRGPNDYFGTGAAVYALFSLPLAMFFGGWVTSGLSRVGCRVELAEFRPRVSGREPPLRLHP